MENSELIYQLINTRLSIENLLYQLEINNTSRNLRTNPYSSYSYNLSPLYSPYSYYQSPLYPSYNNNYSNTDNLFNSIGNNTSSTSSIYNNNTSSRNRNRLSRTHTSTNNTPINNTSINNTSINNIPTNNTSTDMNRINSLIQASRIMRENIRLNNNIGTENTNTENTNTENTNTENTNTENTNTLNTDTLNTNTENTNTETDRQRNRRTLNNLRDRIRSVIPELVEVTLYNQPPTNINNLQVISPLNMEDVPITPSINILRNNTNINIYSNLETNYQSCSICREDFIGSDVVRKINSCNHIFHISCIDIWFESNITCPVCRKDLRVNNEGNESIDNNNSELLEIPL